jgi:hypothetical protein
VLETYDFSTEQVDVTRVALLGAGGAVATPGTIVGAPEKKRVIPPAKKRRRYLTIDKWPSYNGTLAPTTQRTGFSLAQNANGYAVISGGDPKDPICIFDQKANSWVNATELFVGKDQIAIQSEPTSTSVSSTPSATSATLSSTAAASSTAGAATPAASTTHHNRMLTVLGATLGAVFGIAAIVIILLLILRCLKERKKRAGGDGYVEKGDRLSFADRGAEFMSEAGGSVGQNYSASRNMSQDSLAIVSGRAGPKNYKKGHGAMGSDASTAGLVMKPSPLGYSDPVEMAKIDQKTAHIAEKPPHPQPTATAVTVPLGRSRSSGWSRYFANNEATNLAQINSGRSTYASDRTSAGSQSRYTSQYTDSGIYAHPSQAVPPLELNFAKFDNQRMSQVATGSPTLGHSRDNLPGQPMQAELARANSSGSTVSSLERNNSNPFGNGQSATESWTPVSGNAWNQRPASSTYTDSVRDGTNSYYNDGTSSYYPKSNGPSFHPGRVGAAEERDSIVTVFPRGHDSNVPMKKNGAHSDMSWLNLGANGT